MTSWCWSRSDSLPCCSSHASAIRCFRSPAVAGDTRRCLRALVILCPAFLPVRPLVDGEAFLCLIFRVSPIVLSTVGSATLVTSCGRSFRISFMSFVASRCRLWYDSCWTPRSLAWRPLLPPAGTSLHAAYNNNSHLEWTKPVTFKHWFTQMVAAYRDHLNWYGNVLPMLVYIYKFQFYIKFLMSHER